MSDIEIVTFGCRLNAYESEVMRKHASDAGLGATVIVNTCAVTQESVRQARQAIRKARRANPQAKIVVTGCAAQIDPGRGRPYHRQSGKDRGSHLPWARLR
jgi:threonylcarbamoyladenosine tRNA methylthiotransferase MtaB